MNKLTLILIALSMSACADHSHFELGDVAEEARSCQVQTDGDANYLVCPDGSSALIGISNGIIQEIIDPCGDDPKYIDEVLIRLTDGTILAWYKNVGLVVLDNGSYTTTDNQQCSFSIIGGQLYDFLDASTDDLIDINEDDCDKKKCKKDKKKCKKDKKCKYEDNDDEEEK